MSNPQVIRWWFTCNPRLFKVIHTGRDSSCPRRHQFTISTVHPASTETMMLEKNAEPHASIWDLGPWWPKYADNVEEIRIKFLVAASGGISPCWHHQSTTGHADRSTEPMTTESAFLERWYKNKHREPFPRGSQGNSKTLAQEHSHPVSQQNACQPAKNT